MRQEACAAAGEALPVESKETLAPTPEATGIFVAGGVEACLSDVLSDGEPSRVWDALPELMHLAVGSYLGKEAADEAFKEAKEMLESDRSRLEGGAR